MGLFATPGGRSRLQSNFLYFRMKTSFHFFMTHDDWESWREEKQSAYLYDVLSKAEKNPLRKDLFEKLATEALKQAQLWEKRNSNLGAPPLFSPSLRAKIVALLIQRFEAQRIKPVLAAMKVRGLSVYDHKTGHIHEHTMPKTLADVGHRHGGIGTSGNLRAAVFGVNDGLVSNASLLMGIAGASQNEHLFILAGTAGLLAGAASMAAGEYISVRSQREVYEYQIALEKEELREYPNEEAAELSLIYQAKGMEKSQADGLSKKLISNPVHALDTLAREELGLNPDELGSPVGAGMFSFLSFSLGAFIPLIPYLIWSVEFALKGSTALTALSLFTVGSVMSLFTGRSFLWSGFRMLLIGSLAGGLTYVIGKSLGVNL